MKEVLNRAQAVLQVGLNTLVEVDHRVRVSLRVKIDLNIFLVFKKIIVFSCHGEPVEQFQNIKTLQNKP